MRNIFADELYRLAVKDKDVFIVVADISPAGNMIKFQKKYPERFINVGVSEQTMIGVCAGLALQNKKFLLTQLQLLHFIDHLKWLEMTYAIKIFQLQLLEWEQGQFTTI